MLRSNYQSSRPWDFWQEDCFNIFLYTCVVLREFDKPPNGAPYYPCGYFVQLFLYITLSNWWGPNGAPLYTRGIIKIFVRYDVTY